MTGRRLIATLLSAAALAGLLATGAGSRAPARVLVYAQEWSLWPSRVSVPAGPLLVQLANRGQDPHDLRIRALRHGRMTGRAQGVGVTASGRIATAGWRLVPGTYELYCSLAGHLHAGMRTRLVVR
jgi:plastocyanin